MKIEFLDNISDGGKFTGVIADQLIRLFDFDTLQANKLRQKIQEIIIEKGERLDLSKLEFIETINCNLVLSISDVDTGILINNENNFICEITTDGYKNMVDLLEPFCIKDSSNIYQWLYEIDTPIEFLFSSKGTW